jgi:DNA-binding CsgD family transcriptional regulator
MHIDRFYEVSQATDMDGFQKRLIGMAAELEFAIVSGSLVIENPVDKSDFQLHSFGNTPQAYLDSSYFSKDAAARDPVAKAVKYSSVPFCYDQDVYLKAGAIDLWEEQAAFGYKNGICVGMHLPGHIHFLLGVDRDLGLPRDGVEVSRVIGQLQLLAVHAQAAAVGILLPSMEDAPPTLSRREMEILKWARDGKTSWEIGKIIGISEQGVKYHVTEIMFKLDAPNRNQAVLKAIRFGLL